MRYSLDDGAGIARRRRGRGFEYRRDDGRVVRDRATLERIRALAIPPAWTEVWISPDHDAHIQATGRDARGRKQYRYHAKWRAMRDADKYGRLVAFCRALPKIRAAVERDLACRCLCKRKVVATIVSLMETAQLRVGNDEYARHNGSYGATTLRDHHARFRGSTLELVYRGKSGIVRHVRVTDRRLSRIVRSCRDLPGQRLFQYVDPRGGTRPVTSSDVNSYLRAHAGRSFSAKDYRTWAATLAAALLLGAIDHPGTERACQRRVREALETIAERLGHTPAICRGSYVHPRLLDDFTGDRLAATRLARAARRLARGGRRDPIAVDTLRAIEPSVAAYLDSAPGTGAKMRRDGHRHSRPVARRRRDVRVARPRDLSSHRRHR